MRRLLFVLLLLVVVLAGAGAAFVATWDIPPPTETIRKEVPNERFAN
ncbi:MAG: hypothetical protein VYB54_08965 [Pseudomonadota bacterium]|nr:hypothetical protein [Pseudomonadota bacterium]